MSQREIDEAVASVTGENIAFIRDRGFSIADPWDVTHDPEARSPLVLDWDSMATVTLPEI
jgi:hypothetical protein